MGDRVYTVIDVAKYIINYCQENDNPISNLQLQKLLYYVQLLSYRERNCRMFKEEVSAWKHGPVVVKAYEAFKEFRWGIFAYEDSFFDGVKESIDLQDVDIIKRVCDSKMKLTPWQIVDETHRQPPWKETFQGYGRVIPEKLLINFAKTSDFAYCIGG